MGFSRKVDPLGRVVLPADWRREQGVACGDFVSLSAEEEKLIIAKVEMKCSFCRGELEYPSAKFLGKYICNECLKQIKQL